MRPAVLAAFWAFTVPLEGSTDGMYCDVLGLVTTGVGNLIDSVSASLALPWRTRVTGLPSTTAEVADEWHAVKNGRIPWRPGTRPLYLEPHDIQALVLQRLQQNEAYLARRWANWASWPADAQLGAHSCAWAAGAGWRAPHFDAAAAKLDFLTIAGPPGDAGANPGCRGEAWLNDAGNPGLRPRNLANKALFASAAAVVAVGGDREKLHWP